MEITKKIIILALLLATILSSPFNISFGIYFGVLTNVMINVFWTANISFKKIKSIKDEPFGFNQPTINNEISNLKIKRPYL